MVLWKREKTGRGDEGGKGDGVDAEDGSGAGGGEDLSWQAAEQNQHSAGRFN